MLETASSIMIYIMPVIESVVAFEGLIYLYLHSL